MSSRPICFAQNDALSLERETVQSAEGVKLPSASYAFVRASLRCNAARYRAMLADLSV
jgi:hypothetical protein